MKLSLGQVLITRRGLEQIPIEDIFRALLRHRRADWGDLDIDDRMYNDFALQHGERITSAYYASDQTHFWVFTEWNRSLTTDLLPEEY
jgi:hypothetical protein